jgi:hypothetical protein
VFVASRHGPQKMLVFLTRFVDIAVVTLIFTAFT